jgi:hypothetical protein
LVPQGLDGGTERLIFQMFSPDFVKLRAGGHADAAAGGT